MKADWVNDKYRKCYATFEVSAIIYSRIPKHTTELVKDTKKAIKSLYLANGNIKIKKVVCDWLAEPLIKGGRYESMED